MIPLSRTRTVWPADLATVRSRLKLDDSWPEDSDLTGYIKEAVSNLEGRTGNLIAKGTAVFRIDNPFGGCPPRKFRIPGMNAELTGIDYLAQDAVSRTTFEKSKFDTAPYGPSKALRMQLKEGEDWPVEAGDIRIAVNIGVDQYGLPDDMKSALMLQIRQLYDGYDYSRERHIMRVCGRYYLHG